MNRPNTLTINEPHCMTTGEPVRECRCRHHGTAAPTVNPASPDTSPVEFSDEKEGPIYAGAGRYVMPSGDPDEAPAAALGLRTVNSINSPDQILDPAPPARWGETKGIPAPEPGPTANAKRSEAKPSCNDLDWLERW